MDNATKARNTLYQNAASNAAALYGKGWGRIGASAQRAAVAEEIFGLIARQDDLISAETVKTLVSDGWTWLTDNYPL